MTIHIAETLIQILSFIFVFLIYVYVFLLVKSLVKIVLREPGHLPPSLKQMSPGQVRFGEENSGEDFPDRERPGAPGIIILKDPEGRRGEIFSVRDLMIIGRNPECHLPLADAYASSQHARIFFQDGGIFIEDLDSTNGTFVNGIRVSDPSALEDGAQIQIGQTILEFKAG
ncbi:hypothetical protein HKBW3S44_01115 [Candidatus Hakubella thermalkaliphila]|uniref:FHA domain-containing protein n=3 Tax=Candidatus Hakubella thermalkaliphila TaxID=2754717 RepID=A0A6V8P9T8_9ACTN|nr:hypothetical protein HKBW3S09_00723 [Candidatus Hakubella thermalkaliphila]GFP29439.1 hypothetical protein HKBW3S34_00359 [Candidatus Hakubella thermalkaliphila]GFP37435.1 hypothetical protein HKBW3S44_01115 [Candidatus Hakubella thermalkaliphila]GFP39871.1 hypothetical protein HKBW3S47_01568 [Candidatus Hakubella thermalkaliphila]